MTICFKRLISDHDAYMYRNISQMESAVIHILAVELGGVKVSLLSVVQSRLRSKRTCAANFYEAIMSQKEATER